MFVCRSNYQIRGNVQADLVFVWKFLTPKTTVKTTEVMRSSMMPKMRMKRTTKRMMKMRRWMRKGMALEREKPAPSQTKKAAATMCVGMGSFYDPHEAQGLAHFLGKHNREEDGWPLRQ